MNIKDNEIIQKISDAVIAKIDGVKQRLAKKAVSVIGIDIGSTSIKLIELIKNGDEIKVVAFADELLPLNAVMEREIKDINLVSETINRAHRRAHAANTNVATAVSGNAIITKIIQLPSSLSDEELESQIELEAERHIPYAQDEVSIDFEVIGPSATGSGLVDILLAACRTDNVDICVDVCELAGLRTKIVDIEVYALERAMGLVRAQVDDYQHKVVALVDLGSQISTLSVFKGGQLLYTRDQVFGGNILIEQIQRMYGLNYDEAFLKREESDLPEGYYKEVLLPFKQSIAEQIDTALQFFYTQSEIEQVDCMFLAGGVAMVNGLADWVEQTTHIQTVVANPLQGMKISPKVNKPLIERHAPSMMIACGLAMRSF